MCSLLLSKVDRWAEGEVRQLYLDDQKPNSASRNTILSRQAEFFGRRKIVQTPFLKNPRS